MSYLKAPQLDELTLPSSTPETPYTVKMKQRASFGDQRFAQSAMLRVDGLTGQVSDPEWGAYIRALLTRLIVSWNLTDVNDQPLPITGETIDELDPADGQFLAAEATSRSGYRSEKDARPFVKQSDMASAAIP